MYLLLTAMIYLSTLLTPAQWPYGELRVAVIVVDEYGEERGIQSGTLVRLYKQNDDNFTDVKVTDDGSVATFTTLTYGVYNIKVEKYPYWCINREVIVAKDFQYTAIYCHENWHSTYMPFTTK